MSPSAASTFKASRRGVRLMPSPFCVVICLLQKILLKLQAPDVALKLFDLALQRPPIKGAFARFANTKFDCGLT